MLTYEFETVDDEDWVDEYLLSGNHKVVAMVRETWKNLQEIKEDKNSG